MEVAEQQREWQKEEVEEEEEAALEVRRPRNLATVATGVSDTISGDETPPFSQPVSEPEEVEHRQEELHYDSNGNTDESSVFELRKPRETGGGNGEEEMRTSSGPVYEFQEEEEECRQEELRDGIEVEPDVLQKLEKNVYYDQDHGMWKCRNCCWTYQSGCPWTDHAQHYNSHIHMLMNSKSVNQWGQFFFCETEGTETFSGYSVTDTSSVQGFASENFFGDDESVATLTKVESQRDDNFAGFRLQPSEKSSEGHRTNKSLTDITETHDEIQLIKETDNELIEFDVERVLEKQDTHDLYCPNCHSCITRKVILRKRKRNIRISVDDPKRSKLETEVASELHATNAADISLAASVEPADEYDHVREPEIFRCLSCFSFFIPSGEGFTLFKIFGDKSVKEKIQSPQPIPVVKKNWLLSIFASRKEEMSSEQGNSDETYSEENSVVQSSTAKHQNGSIVPPSAQGPKLVGEPTAGDIIEKGAAVEDSKLQKPVPVGSDISGEGNILPDFPAEKGEIAGATLPISSLIKSRNVEIKIIRNGTAYPAEVSQHSTNGTKVDMYKEETFKSDKAHKAALSLPTQDAQLLQDTQAKAQKGALSLPVQDAQLLQDTPANITKDPAKSSASPDTRITIEGPVEPTGSQEAIHISTSPVTVPLLRPQSAEARESNGLEIIKSIVYGGLMESITSLGIVSSAAGADASTVNILALGVANLIGGLFVIGHHLWDLKDDHPMETSNQVTTQKNRYQELLGRRQNFWLHATVAILSFLIFGLVPPVVYSFAFRVSDVDYKLIAVAGASLLCIILLAIGKVYVQTQRTAKAYLKTITYYVVMGFMASGVSYAIGDLIKILMAKLGWFDSTQALTFPTPGWTTPRESAWGSY